MRKKLSFSGFAIGIALLGAGFTSSFAADETLRSLADKNNIYLGAILNSQWLGGGLPGNYEQILKTQFILNQTRTSTLGKTDCGCNLVSHYISYR